jgi:hypothetical protein
MEAYLQNMIIIVLRPIIPKNISLTRLERKMYNYEHEIDCPNDIYIRNYLWNDYFHDSEIKSIEFISRFGSLTKQLSDISIILDSNRDKEKKESHYILRFVNCAYYRQESSVEWSQYINGRFKDSALLVNLKQYSKKDYYHFRIQTADGYIDIVFSKFIIRKVHGRVRVKDIDTSIYESYWLKNYQNGELQDPNGSLNQDKIIELAESGDDVYRYFALSYLLFNTQQSLLEYAREIIKSDWKVFEMSAIAAIQIMGVQGDEKDLYTLYSEYNFFEKHLNKDTYNYSNVLLPKRHIMDAIERIQNRLINSGNH